MPEEPRIRKCLEQNMFILGEDNEYQHLKRRIDPQNIENMITFKHSGDDMGRFIEDVINLNKFHINGSFSLDIIYTENNEIESEKISYTGELLYEENVSMSFEYSNDNICEISFHTWNNDDKVNITEDMIDKENIKEIIAEFELIGEKYFS